MRAVLVLCLSLMLAVPVAAADDDDPPTLPDVDGPDPSTCRPYCLDSLPGPEPSTCRPYCDFMDDL